MKKVTLLLLFLLLAPVLFIYYVVAKADVHDDVIKEKTISDKSTFNVCSYLRSNAITADSLYTRFPYELYAGSANIWHVKTLAKDLRGLDSFNTKDAGINRKILSEAWTTGLRTQLTGYYEHYHPDSLLRLLQWAEKFQTYAEIDADNDILYESIYHYWMDIISNKLSDFSNEQPSRLYDYKFSYLRARLVEKRFAPAVKITSKDKFFLNLLTGNWGHLMNASWNQASVSVKCILLIGALIFGCGLYFITQRTYKLIIKKVKQ